MFSCDSLSRFSSGRENDITGHRSGGKFTPPSGGNVALHGGS